MWLTRPSVIAVAPALDGANAHASDEPVAGGGAQRLEEGMEASIS
jgi:hypothetical protein